MMSDVKCEDIEALTSLGLTMLQATVYLTLVESGNSTIKEIAKNAGVARQDLYRITSELQEYGLVEQIITKPIRYKAVPLKSGVTVLLNDLHRKRSEAQKKALELIQRYKNKEVPAENNVEKHQFVLVSGKNTLVLKEKSMFKAAQKNIAIITSNKRFSQRLYSSAHEYKNLVTESVKVRVIMEKGEAEKHLGLLNELAKSYKEKVSIEVKYIRNPPPVAMAVVDKKEVIIVASASAALTDAPSLWSNNTSLVELAHSYFETMWLKSRESIKPE